MGFLGTFANLTGYRLGSFRIESLIGRDAAGYPKWRIVCGKCGESQIMVHAKIAALIESKAPENLQCTNGACQLSRTHRSPVTLSDLRHQERCELEEAARNEEAAKQAAAEQSKKDAKLARLKAEYGYYYRHQLGTGATDSDVVSFERWQKLVPETRKMVMEHLKADPTVYFRGL
jgi:hypothetical protein